MSFLSTPTSLHSVEASPHSEAWLVLLDLDHELVDVDQLSSSRDLREWSHAKHTAESEQTKIVNQDVFHKRMQSNDQNFLPVIILN